MSAQPVLAARARLVGDLQALMADCARASSGIPRPLAVGVSGHGVLLRKGHRGLPELAGFYHRHGVRALRRLTLSAAVSSVAYEFGLLTYALGELQNPASWAGTARPAYEAADAGATALRVLAAAPAAELPHWTELAWAARLVLAVQRRQQQEMTT